MVKKKRQSSPGERGDESTESCDENVKSGCPHVAKALDLARLKRAIKRGGFFKECYECANSPSAEAIDPDFEVDSTLWMCLRCGVQLCGRARNKHALSHFNTPHSDCHALTANTTTWELFCYDCNNEVGASSTKKLLECIEYLKKQASSAPVRSHEVIALPEPMPLITTVEPIKTSWKIASFGGERVRGLSNLGNTCFFNSVMQCLVQTPYLLPVLQEMSQTGERFTLPGGRLVLENKGEEKREVELPPISGELSEWGSFTRTLAETLADLQAPGKSEVYTPRALLSALIAKLPQFGGGDQHDSHELLRHLLEAVRSEDLRRYQAVILKSLGLSSKIDPSKVDGDIKQKVKFYGQQASDTMLRPEQVFRGFMVSTLECQECFHTSERPEYFLDLSLPVAANRPQPPAVVRRKTPSQDENMYGSTSQEESKVSKHQQKKERNAARKAARKSKDKSGKRNGNSSNKIEENGPNGEMNTNNEENKSSSEQSDADVEDNLEDNPKQADTHTASVGSQAVAHTAANFAAYHMESGYNSEKVVSDSIRASPIELDKEKTDTTPERHDKDKEFVDSATATTTVPLEYKPLVSLENLSNPDSGVASPDATKNNSTETVDNVDSLINGKDLGSQSSLSSELNLDLSGSGNPKLSPIKNDYERPVSRISFAPEASNELISRGISIEGSSNLLKYGKGYERKSYENLAEASKTSDNLNDISNSLEMIKLQRAEMNMKLPLKKPSIPYQSPYADDAAIGGSTSNDLTKSNNLDMDSSLRRDYLPSFSYRPCTVSPRYQCDEGECSIQSCLNQFTALELMTGNNKVGCEACTERINGKNGKTVYTNATKQFLVSSPPAVLILHLKRFQLGPRCMFRKMTKQVDFPTVLDLAPFCSTKKFKSLPNVAPGQTELLYSLYGVVEHSGGMHGGHYVAYVKVRPPIRPGDARYTFLPTGGNVAKDEGEDSSKDSSRTDGDSDSSLSGYESGEAPAPTVETPPGRWFYVSDSMVSEVTEEKVLRAQAYLLFYERIL